MSEVISNGSERRKPWLLLGSTVAALGLVAGGSLYIQHESTEMNKKVRASTRAINVADLAMRTTCYRTTLPVINLDSAQRIIAGVPNKLWYKFSIKRDSKHVDLSSTTSFLFNDGWMYNAPFTGNEHLHIGVVGSSEPVDAQICGGVDGDHNVVSVLDNDLKSHAQVVLLADK